MVFDCLLFIVLDCFASLAMTKVATRMRSGTPYNASYQAYLQSGIPGSDRESRTVAFLNFSSF